MCYHLPSFSLLIMLVALRRLIVVLQSRIMLRLLSSCLALCGLLLLSGALIWQASFKGGCIAACSLRHWLLVLHLLTEWVVLRLLLLLRGPLWLLLLCLLALNNWRPKRLLLWSSLLPTRANWNALFLKKMQPL
ncbi:uncharacterized protein LOC115769106 [Drosophila novamexicana]|uniref:uncharacterized protein LOC115768415 n=1 Tax=Drosophila novamexicana TaxID=47314 RepID=UPI0011E5F8B4|nr:uncharacterized protein LOC115768415 [Drosophila novamexicana]XP_030568846.1 uncharacterized protein LOC115768417 [Drosophila novamexicana]XP_030568847.1 uncharacterized protein LOC115768418 [Drosophila novamexicana]XP_030568849.1 uncharacterized protein LOC115768421 [Drosophila novamexicana]XP_030568850.1 uncharacterized protein LOC115768422 [Drosophila novamexicana]XP_030568892.1 uncharacterized protein LOC115768462 [Drosophila novamexicana]XP_030568893.1 uncharacterized protein LOC11576